MRKMTLRAGRPGIVFLVACLGTSAPAIAADAPRPVLTILGVALGGPFALDQCTMEQHGDQGYVEGDLTYTCVVGGDTHADGTQEYTVYLPAGSDTWVSDAAEFYLRKRAGAVVDILIHTAGLQTQDDDLAQIEKLLGKPSQLARIEHLPAGTEAIEARWNRNGYVARFASRAGKGRLGGRLEIWTTAYGAVRAAHDEGEDFAH